MIISSTECLHKIIGTSLIQLDNSRKKLKEKCLKSIQDSQVFQLNLKNCA